MDSYELSGRLHSIPENEDAMFTALTGYGQAYDQVLAKAVDFDHYFVKPMDVGAFEKIRAVAE